MILTTARHRPLHTEYDGDSDDLDDSSLAQLEQPLPTPTGSRSGRRDQTVPLLVGLLDASNVRRSSDAPLDNEYSLSHSIDLEELAQKQHAGGGMLQSVANMANSILGAGTVCQLFQLACRDPP
jgi:solute carrier family 38 (sodium-coupled neutral amino acid transporter), member 11